MLWAPLRFAIISLGSRVRHREAGGVMPYLLANLRTGKSVPRRFDVRMLHADAGYVSRRPCLRCRAKVGASWREL
ncbi:MAG: hypothetical protein JWL84_2625 [Rhodospirillales bacterium]|nr:hypothetical protein [Rhodospirillales bacterium]